MTLRHMKIFVAVYQNSSITKAAADLHLAQPSVSVSIRELEEYYGIHLFERIGRHIVPTEGAKELYGYALHIVSLFEEMEQKMKNWDAFGTLRVGASITIGTHILPVLLRLYEEKYPERTVEVIVNKSSAIEQDILNGRIDIGLIENQPGNQDTISEPFASDSLCAIVSPGHPLTRLKIVSLEQMAKYPFLMREKGSAGREILEACFSERQITVRPLWESVSTQAIVRAVAEGLGVAVLPLMLVEKDIREGTVAAVSLDNPMKRDLNIIYHRKKYLTSNMKAFMELCRS